MKELLPTSNAAKDELGRWDGEALLSRPHGEVLCWKQQTRELFGDLPPVKAASATKTTPAP